MDTHATHETAMTDTNETDPLYEAFIAAKAVAAPDAGFDPPLPITDSLFPFQRDIVRWALRKGRAAIFAAFGLGKTRMQIELARQVCEHTSGRFLITCPLGVRTEFMRDAAAMGVSIVFIRRTEEAGEQGVYLTNYESVRDANADGSRKVDPRMFDGASLDEASCLRGFGGTKTFREFMALFAGDDRRDMSQRIMGESVRYRFVATATPSPNDFIELLAYSAFLDVMEVSGAKTRFFQRDSEKSDSLTLHPHKEREFWLWVSTWATFVTRPSDISAEYDDSRYVLPPLKVNWHELPTDHLARTRAKAEKEFAREGRAQTEMFANAAAGITDAARESRESLTARIAKAAEIVSLEPGEHFVLWHDLEDERHEIERTIPRVQSVYGSQDLDAREETITAFSDGAIPLLAAKPVMLGSGVNLQRHCRRAIFCGVGYKFNDFIQAIHRIYRFLQAGEVVIDIIYTEAQREIRKVLEEKWRNHNVLVAEMTAIVREHGLTGGPESMVDAMRDKITCERQEMKGDGWEIVNNDSIDEFRSRESNTLGMILTSIPFSQQYKYSDSYRDLGHVDTNAHFWAQMDFLTPNLFRCLKPGRIAAIHVKDRIVPGGMTGLGFQTVYPFHADAITHYTKHGFAYMGMITVVTDVVRENNQTYRLGWTEHSKDSTKIGVGMPEYVLLFRKPPTSSEKSYADEPVTHGKGEYTRGRWQMDAHALWRASGDRFLTIDDLAGMDHAGMFQAFKRWSESSVYDHEAVVSLCEALDDQGMLPSDFMLFQPVSHNEEVWTDIARMRTMNTLQAAHNRIAHICPLQFDIVTRLINRFTNPGDIVADPFGGLGTVAHEAVKLGRKGLSCELSPVYYAESLRYMRALDRKRSTPTLFDLDAGMRKSGESETSPVLGADGARMLRETLADAVEDASSAAQEPAQIPSIAVAAVGAVKAKRARKGAKKGAAETVSDELPLSVPLSATEAAEAPAVPTQTAEESAA